MNGAGPRARLRLVRYRTRARVALLRLGAGIARRDAEEVWIGDSHAVLLNTARFPVVVERVEAGRYVSHLGPRLMYSVARDDFPGMLRRAARAFRLLPGSGTITYVFCLGEIDVRCHLAPRLDDPPDPAFVAGYLRRVRELVHRLGATDAVVVVPPPPSGAIRDHEAFPTVGTVEERLRAHRWLRQTLHEAARTALPADVPRGITLRLLDPTDALSDENGLLRGDLTDDGCHTNAAGRAVVRQELLATT